MQTPSPELEGLFVEQSEQAIDTRIKSTLGPLLGFTRDGKIVTKDSFLKLPLPARVLSILLAQLAMVRLGVANAKPEAGAEHLASDCMATLKACRESLSRLKAKNLLAKNERGYSIPIWAVAKAADEIRNS